MCKMYTTLYDTIQKQVVRYCEAKGDAKDNSSASWAQAVGGNYATLRVCMVWLSIVEECCDRGGSACNKARASPFWGHGANIRRKHIFQIKPAYTLVRLCVQEGSFVAVTAVTLSAHI